MTEAQIQQAIVEAECYLATCRPSVLDNNWLKDQLKDQTKDLPHGLNYGSDLHCDDCGDIAFYVINNEHRACYKCAKMWKGSMVHIKPLREKT